MFQKSFTSVLLKLCIYTFAIVTVRIYRCVSYYLTNFTFGSFFFSLSSSFAKSIQTHLLLPSFDAQTHQHRRTELASVPPPKRRSHHPPNTVQPSPPNHYHHHLLKQPPPPKPVKTTKTQNTTKIKHDLPKIHKKNNLKLNHQLKTHNPNPKSKSKYKLNGSRTLEIK